MAYRRFSYKNGEWVFHNTDGTESRYTNLGNGVEHVGNYEEEIAPCSELRNTLISCDWDFEKYPLCPICVNGRWGFVNASGEYSIPLKYDSAGIESHENVWIHCCTHQLVSCHFYWNSHEYESETEPHPEVKPFCCPVKLGERHFQIDRDGTEYEFEDRSVYPNAIEGSNTLDTDAVIDICRQQFEFSKYYRAPWKHPELGNGISLLKSEEGMNAYMSAYGLMHEIKCRAAFQNFPFSSLRGSIEIVDWGCGQGIGTLTAIDMLKEHNLINWVRRITLIEASEYTLHRAQINVNKATNRTATIITQNRFLPYNNDENEVRGINYEHQNVIHIFSNILDITTINLRKLAHIVATPGRTHYILCVGPTNEGAGRLGEFVGEFGAQELFSDIFSKNFGRLPNGHIFTCVTKCFKYNGIALPVREDESHVPSIVDGTLPSTDYDLRNLVRNEILSEEGYRLYHVLSKLIAQDDLILVKPDIYGDVPDIVIVRPHKGILLISLFEDDITRYSFVEDDEHKISFVNEEGHTIIPPTQTVSNYQGNLIRMYLNGLFLRTVQSPTNWSIIKKMVFFTKNTTTDCLTLFDGHCDRTTLLGREFLDNQQAQERFLENIRFNWDNQVFGDDVMRQFMTIITPKWHPYKEGRHITLFPEQRSLAISRPVQQKISGEAGSGKTEVLVHRAANALIRTGGKILILTFNKTLVNYIRYRLSLVRADFSWGNVTISHYHGFFRCQAERCNKDCNFDSYDDTHFFDGYENKLNKYDAIFVDEVQDYKTEWLKILQKYFLKDNAEFVIFGDPKQNLYHRPWGAIGDIRIGVIRGRWINQLTHARRFTNGQLATLAAQFKDTFLNTEGQTPPPVTPNDMLDFARLRYNNLGPVDNLEALSRLCNNIIDNVEVPLGEVAIIAQSTTVIMELDHLLRTVHHKNTVTTVISQEENEVLKSIHRIDEPAADQKKYKMDVETIEDKKKREFTVFADAETLKMSTVHSFKGWDSPVIIFIMQPEIVEENRIKYAVPASDNVPELIYTAITRPKDEIYIVNLGNVQYHEFFSRLEPFL